MKKWGLLLGIFLWAATLSAQETLQDAVGSYIDSGAFPGFVAVCADADGTITVDAFGWSDREKKIPMSGESFFWIASMTKGITATAVMTLVDEGKIDLDAPVETYLPEFKDVKVFTTNEDGTGSFRTPATKPTVRNMLSHTSGLSYELPQMKQFKMDSIPIRMIASFAASRGLFTDPATRYSYSNLGMDVSAAIIEEVSGMKYEEYLQKKIFDPLEMTETTFWPTPEQELRLATCYRLLDGKSYPDVIPYFQYPVSSRNRHSEAGGGLFSTPVDIIKFYQMLAAHGVYKGKRILSEKAFEELTKKQTADAIEESYTLGLWRDGDWIHHSGALQTHGWANIETGEARVYMVQLTSSSDPAIRGGVHRVLDARAMQKNPKSTPVPDQR